MISVPSLRYTRPRVAGPAPRPIVQICRDAVCATKAWLRLLPLLGALLSPTQALAEVRYFHTDALGSVVAVTDENGNVIERREYEPYGKQLIPVVQDGPGYTGHVQDAATGLTYMQQRYYDPHIGMFLSSDPVTAHSGAVGQFHRYRYANNNPYKFTDPDGREVTCNQDSCTIESHSILETIVDYGTVGIIYARRLIENAIIESQHSESEESSESSGNTNPYDGPVDEPVIVVDSDGNAIPVGEGEQIQSSPDGQYQQVEDRSGAPTGTRMDKGGHRNQKDPKARGPHAHRPGVTDDTGNPHLPIKEPPEPPPTMLP